MGRFGGEINRRKGPVRLFGKTNIDGASVQAGAETGSSRFRDKYWDEKGANVLSDTGGSGSAL